MEDENILVETPVVEEEEIGIDQVLESATVEPDRAAKNIDRANLFDMSEDDYDEVKEEYDPKAEAMERTPASLTGQITTEYMKQSKQKASLVKDDVETLSWVERVGKQIYQHVEELPTIDRQIVELSNKDMDSEKGLSEHESQLLEDLNYQRQELGKEDYGFDGTFEQLPAKILGAVSEIGRSAYNNKALIATTTGTGALMGSGIGFAIPAPGGAPIGGLVGAGKGFLLGMTLSAFTDGYQMMRGSVFNELKNIKDDEGQPLDIDRDTRVNIAHGVAMIGGIAAGGVAHFLGKNNPVLKKFINPKMAATLVTNPAFRAKLDVVGYMLKSAMAGGGAGAVAEFAKIFGEEFAKSDASEQGVLNALGNVATSEHGKRILESASIAGGAAGLIAGVTGAANYRKSKTRYQNINKKIQSEIGPDGHIVIDEDTGTFTVEQRPKAPKDPGGGDTINLLDGDGVANPQGDSVNKSVKVLKAQDGFNDMATAMKSTKFQDLSPAESSGFMKQMFGSIGYKSKIYVYKGDLKDFSDTKEKGEIVRKMIDKDGVMNSEIDAPIGIEPYQFMEIMKEFPEFSEYMRLNPQDPSPKEARNYVERLNEAKLTRSEIMNNLGVDENMTPEQAMEVERALDPVHSAREVFDENSYVDKPTFDDALPGLFTEHEVGKFNTDLLDARLSVQKSFKADVDREFKSKTKETFDEVNDFEVRKEIQSIDNELKLIREFSPKNLKTKFHKDLVANHARKGYSPYALDPAYLTPEISAKYLNNPVLKKRKMFVKGGLFQKDAVALGQVDNIDTLLKILSETPDERQLIKGREQRRIQLKNEIDQGFKAEKAIAQDTAFTNQTKAHLREAKFMREKKWPTNKGLIKNISLKTPRYEELNIKAVGLINKTSLKNLNVNQFMVGERRSHKAAVNHILNMEVEQAIKTKENAALNTELAKATIKAQKRVKVAQAFFKRMQKPGKQEQLREAGMLDAYNEIVGVFNLDPSRRGVVKQGSYDNYVRKQVALGNVDFEIPDKFNDVRESASDMTVEQYLAVMDRVRSLDHQSKMKNRLYNKFKTQKEILTVEAIVSNASKLLEQHPDFKLSRADEVPLRSMSRSERWKNSINVGLTSFVNLKSIATTLDQERLGGVIYDLTAQPIVTARTAKRTRLSNILDHQKELIADYGDKNFNDAINDFRTISEFADYPHLGNGILTRTDLMMMQAYMGDPQGRERISNFVSRSGERLSPEKAQQILDRELTTKDVALVQNLLLDVFKTFTDESFALHERTTGQVPMMIKGVPINHRGKGFAGGYFNLSYQNISDDVKVDKYITSLEKKMSTFSGVEDGKLFGQLKAAEMTEQGRFESRVGSDQPLDLNINNYFTAIEDHVHDISFREAGIDTLKLLRNPMLTKHIKAVVGPRKYKIMTNTIIETVGKTNERNENYFPEHWQVANTMLRKLESGHAVATLGLNIGSIAMQPISLTTASLRMGPNGKKHLLEAASMIMSNMDKVGEFGKIADELNPDIPFAKDGIDDTMIQSTYEFLANPETFFKGHSKSAQNLSNFKQVIKQLNQFSMSGLGLADQTVKRLVTIGAANEFFAGDVPNYPMSRLNKMTDANKVIALKKYVKQVADLALTTSATEDKTIVEKMAHTKMFTKYWTDGRSQLNTFLASGRKVKWGSKKARDSYKEGEKGKAKDEAFNAAGSLLELMITASVVKLYTDLLRGNDTPIDLIRDVNNAEDFKEAAVETVKYFALALPESTIELTPVARDMKFAYSSKGKRDYKNVQLPTFKVLSDFTTGISGTADLVNMMVNDEGSLSKREVKAMLFSSSYLIGGFPINGIYKFDRMMNSDSVLDFTDYVRIENRRHKKATVDFKKKFGNSEAAQDIIKFLEGSTGPEYTNDVSGVIPDTAKDVLRKGDWDTFDGDTGATGIYQFTEERWNEIMKAAPDLALTENGRVSKDSKQQEKAITWSIEDNTRGLQAYEIPINNETLFGAHKFGFDRYVRIHQAPKTEKLSKVFGNEIKDDPLFNKFKTVRSIKDYIKNQVKEN